MPTYFDEELIKRVNNLLSIPSEQQSIITTFKQIMSALKSGNAGVKRQTLHPSALLCHPKNRSGFMLNGFNAHANAVKKIGANCNELHGAVAIEMQPVPAERELQIEANRKLATASQGLICFPDGKEMYLTLGTAHGHMASLPNSQRRWYNPFQDTSRSRWQDN